MQNYTNYIIGFLILIAVGGIIYAINMPDKSVSERELTNDVIGASAQNINTATNTNTTNKKMSATYKLKMETNKGNIELELNTNIAPKTVENFLKLSNSGFYNGVKFHRVINGFMIQGGDPNSKDDKAVNTWGMGGPGYKFEDEIFDTETYRTGYKRGVLAMANSGPNTNGSQFFIMHADYPLPPNYTIFGKVISGLETVDAIANVQTGQSDRPVEPVVINKITVE